jgi:3',5'-nucleoside bisphosphate phosphatase
LDYRKQVGIDLHIHSNASDGSFSPGDILRHAIRLGLKAISITDHDTLAGVKDALCASIPESIRLLPGVEISAQLPENFQYAGGCHILGYFINPDDRPLNDALKLLMDARINRNPVIIKKLNALGIDISLEELGKDVQTRQAGRPHIAQALIRKKIVSSIDEAFEKYLGYGRPAHVGKYRIPCAKAIALIRDAGGIPVLAHPFLIETIDAPSFEALIKTQTTMGLMGIEVYYPGHTADMTAYYASVARRFGLLITGGTDFHGTLTPGIEMGVGKGNLFIPYEVCENLIIAKNTIDRYRIEL